MKGINLYHEVPCGSPDEFHVVVDLPKGSTNKIEYDEQGGYFKLDRTLFTPTFYPFDYGFIPQTHAGDGDATDVCLLLTHPTFSGCVVKARPIGMIKTADQDGDDAKIIAVPVSKVDPRFDEMKTLDDLPAHFREELLLFFKEYKKLEKKKYDLIQIDGFGSVEEAKAEIQQSMDAYKEKHA
ncbi:inorganic pyrophosphatase [Candidatus Uhrbacteria bacterium CG22_combo_CG10-13_8_21_14_all_47_17]|uniref:Inorganic pyrophosphatase n=1 Tax=Candidatus Uhrbacteria bacterium CG22_combo_CG10-13_8_21_14_all_47_17 TaxID=1975041 RepID=A0A2H0BTK8_9BACT|nr:MAG: inorganic pyrophosphatase [Candidatus Uhrbacteria bacterium CG22_combo_CG10-13_8_21_14_all_47_17]